MWILQALQTQQDQLEVELTEVRVIEIIDSLEGLGVTAEMGRAAVAGSDARPVLASPVDVRSSFTVGSGPGWSNTLRDGSS